NKIHGFLLSNGQFTTINYPDAQTTIPGGIGPNGDIVGLEVDPSGTLRGFLLRNGNFSSIDFPGANGTFPTMIISGHIVGGYFDNAGSHGFLLYRGNFQGIDCPGYTNLFLSGLDPIGQMTGGFFS